MNQETAKQFFENFIQRKTVEFVALAQSGSARQNFVGNDGEKKFVITYNENIRENEAFFYFSEKFSGLGLNTPQIFKISDDQKLYIQEHLGENTLSEIIEKENISERTKSLVKQTLEKLFLLQTKTLVEIDYTHTFEYEKYDETPILHDLNYFKFFFIDILELHYHKSTLLKEFRKIAERIENLQPKGLMIRDFQARNIMVNKCDEISFIDYQGAMNGPLMYDVVSFLYQAKANFPEDFRQEMLDFYISKFDEENQLQLKLSAKPLQMIRFIQVLGAYGFRGLIQRKKHFLLSIEKGIENLYNFSENCEEIKEFPELRYLISKLKTKEIKDKVNNILNH